MGFSKVTMDELVDQLGISKKTMYQYFRSKDELIEAVIEWQFIHVGARLKEIMNSSMDFVDKLYSLWTMIGEVLSRFSKQFQDDLRRFRHDLWRRIEKIRRENILTNFTKLVDEGMNLGLIRTDVNKEVLLHIYLSTVQGVINPEVLVQHSFSAEEAFKTILRVLLDGILTDSARQKFRKRIFTQK